MDVLGTQVAVYAVRGQGRRAKSGAVINVYPGIIPFLTRSELDAASAVMDELYNVLHHGIDGIALLFERFKRFLTMLDLLLVCHFFRHLLS
jgi:hypothetical protein